jgi:hypothetical protein
MIGSIYCRFKTSAKMSKVQRTFVSNRRLEGREKRKQGQVPLHFTLPTGTLLVAEVLITETCAWFVRQKRQKKDSI